MSDEKIIQSKRYITYLNKAKLKIGQRFGQWKIIDIIEDKYHTDGIYYKCLCDCGTISDRLLKHLLTGRSTSCGCYNAELTSLRFKGKTHTVETRLKVRDSNFVGVGEISQGYLNNFKKNANKRNIEYNLSNEFLWELFLKQNRKCKLSNLDIHFYYSGILGDKTSQTCSLDRIDSNKGYQENNVQWVHKDINRIKYIYDLDYFYKMCYYISNPIVNNTKLMYENIKHRYNWKGYKNLSKSYYYRIVSSANTRKLQFDISIEDMWNKYEEQNGRCYFTNTDLKFKSSTQEQTASIDRIDNKIGYTFENIRWIHKHINLSRSQYNDEYYKMLALAVTDSYCFSGKSVDLLVEKPFV